MTKVAPFFWLLERTPAVFSEDSSQEEDVSWIGHAEELRREGRLVRRVCEGARDALNAALHVRSRLEVRAGAGCRRRHRRLEVWIVAPLGVGSEEPRHVSWRRVKHPVLLHRFMRRAVHSYACSTLVACFSYAVTKEARWGK